jgi:hypothetical protein
MKDKQVSDAEDRAEFVPPNAAQLINALRQIGYSFEQAIADLIDNCINADASNVLVRIVHDDKKVQCLQIVDDGHGMTERLLKQAMRFGAHEDAKPKSLGKFGMGMKVASLSHAKTLSVYTSAGTSRSGRRWTVERIAENWMLDRISQKEIADVLTGDYQGINLATQGTVVEWSRIDRLPLNQHSVDATIDKLFGRLKIHLGLHFHRFIETKRIAIQLDSYHAAAGEQERAISVSALNPFKYEESGDPAYPMNFPVDIPGVGSVLAIAHIWPPNSTSAEYKLGNRAASRQGFYFYRHDRLIQAGGWNGVVEHETEPHSSLARVAIELPESLDAHFGLNIKKSRIDVPPPFPEAMQGASANDGTQFTKYRRTADQVYRKKDTRSQSDLPLVPVAGLPASVARRAKELLADGNRVRAVDVIWDDLGDQDIVFDVDRDRMCIRLDKRLRRKLLAGRRATVADLPVVKLLFFFLLEQEFDRARQSSRRKQQLQAISDILQAALREEG